jgi:hypothetical protein
MIAAAIKRIERRQDELSQAGLVPLSLPSIQSTAGWTEKRKKHLLTVAYLRADPQAKDQFVAPSRRLLETGIVKLSALGLPKQIDSEPKIDWHECKRIRITAHPHLDLNVAPKGPFAHPKQPRRLLLGQPSRLPTLIRFFKSHLPSLL